MNNTHLSAAARNAAAFAWRKHGVSALLDKALDRLEPNRRAEGESWAGEHATDFQVWAEAQDEIMCAEGLDFARHQFNRGRQVLDDLGIRMGGEGHTALLHVLVRLLRPSVVVETGVAAGWSSEAILAALNLNGTGALYSSDLPYVNDSEPKHHIGILVPEHLRYRWTLLTDGDRVNVRTITRTIRGPVDLVHYDSAKSARARERTMRALEPFLSPRCVVVFDDIGDNLHFKQFVERTGRSFNIFAFQRKYVGLAQPAERTF